MLVQVSNRIIYKGENVMEIQFRTNETVELEMASDYWKALFGVVQFSQIRGRYWFTNERVIFAGGFSTKIEIEYDDIASIKKCFIGPIIRFMPFGILVTTKSGEKHYFSILNRNKAYELLESKINKNS